MDPSLGLHQVNFMKNLAESDNMSDVVDKLERISQYALNQCIKDSRYCLVSSPDHMLSAEGRLEKFLGTLPHQVPGIHLYFMRYPSIVFNVGRLQ